MASVCIHCKNDIRESDVCFECDGCHRPIHGSCTELSASEIKCLQLKKRIMKFFCNHCNAGLSGLPDLLATINIMRQEIAELKEAMSHKSVEVSSNSGRVATSELVTKVVNECRERELRKSNVVIFGLHEATAGVDDRMSVESVLRAVEPNVEMADVKLYRLGKSVGDAGKPRPVRVIFPSSAQVENIIKKAGRLGASQRYQSVYINYDKTPCQLEKYRRLRSELKTRLDGGESNLRISFVNGEQRIVKRMFKNRGNLN